MSGCCQDNLWKPAKESLTSSIILDILVMYKQHDILTLREEVGEIFHPPTCSPCFSEIANESFTHTITASVGSEFHSLAGYTSSSN